MTAKKRDATGEELNQLFHEVCDLHDALSAAWDEVHERVGLRSSQYRVAHTLEDLGSAAVPEIAASLNVTRQFVQIVCNGLEEMGLVEFRDSPRHKRSRLLSLTEKGRRTLERSRRAQASIIENALPGMDVAKVAEAAGLLRVISGEFRKKRI